MFSGCLSGSLWLQDPVQRAKEGSGSPPCAGELDRPGVHEAGGGMALAGWCWNSSGHLPRHFQAPAWAGALSQIFWNSPGVATGSLPVRVEALADPKMVSRTPRQFRLLGLSVLSSRVPQFQVSQSADWLLQYARHRFRIEAVDRPCAHSCVSLP